jgi:hypothetical protein
MPTSVDVNPCPDGEVKYDASGYLELSSIGSVFDNFPFSSAEEIAEGTIDLKVCGPDADFIISEVRELVSVDTRAAVRTTPEPLGLTQILLLVVVVMQGVLLWQLSRQRRR